MEDLNKIVETIWIDQVKNGCYPKYLKNTHNEKKSQIEK